MQSAAIMIVCQPKGLRKESRTVPALMVLELLRH